MRVLLRAGFAAELEAGLAREAAVLRVPVDTDLGREAAGFFAALLRDRAVEDLARDVEALRAPELRDDDVEAPLVESSLHLPDITRCAASATASAISEPNLVALAIMLLAACEAVSAASSPASRIARRALGLALIAAAAAASPAASISLLIAALASLSTVSEEEPEEPRLEDLARDDLAIASSPSVGKRHFKPVTVPE